MARVATIFGTRPEVIKLAPVIQELERRRGRFETLNITSSQHKELLSPFTAFFGIRVDHDLHAMRENQSPTRLCARVLEGLEPILAAEKPDVVLVQGDTSTALAGALASFYARIPVGHVEAGLRTASIESPFPEEANRRLISRITRYHFAATPHNVATLVAEGIPEERVVLTGNPVVDALRTVLRTQDPSPELARLLERLRGYRVVVLTTHRRESFGEQMRQNLSVLKEFVVRNEDVVLVFPVHPNPHVRDAVDEVLARTPRIEMLEPLGYVDFILLLSVAWLIVSDSGGVQEEAPSLGKPLLVLRDTTERPEVIEAGVAKLVGGSPGRLRELLEEVHAGAPWARRVAEIENPFGRGDSGSLIVSALEAFLGKEGRALDAL